MRLATIDSIAATKTLCASLNNLPAYAASVNGDVNLINSYLIPTTPRSSQGYLSTVNNPITKLFEAYLSVPDYNLKQYISKRQDNYHNGNF
jgi:hypothetical protein